MPESEVSIQPTLGLLEPQKTRFGSYGVSIILNALVLLILALFTMLHPHFLKNIHHNESLTLLAPPPEVKPYVPPVPKVKVSPPPAIQAPKMEQAPRLQSPREPVPAPSRPIALPQAELPKIASAAPKAVVLAPQTKAALMFAEAAKPTSQHSILKSAGIGSVVASTSQAHPAVVGTALGGFGGSTLGTTTHGAVRGAGITSAGIGGSGRRGYGTVASAGIRQVAAQVRPAASFQPVAPAETPIVITSKPRPLYPEEARQLKIEGEVVLQVRFRADGRVDVLRVISGLGHGLDEAARNDAMQIRFKPATRNGVAVDSVNVIRISFHLA